MKKPYIAFFGRGKRFKLESDERPDIHLFSDGVISGTLSLIVETARKTGLPYDLWSMGPVKIYWRKGRPWRFGALMTGYRYIRHKTNRAGRYRFVYHLHLRLDGKPEYMGRVYAKRLKEILASMKKTLEETHYGVV